MAEASLQAEGVAFDVTDSAAVQAFIANVEPCHILVNSAGTARHSPFAEITPANYQTVMDLNLAATLFVSQAVVARLVEEGLSGSIIHISSQMGHVGGPARAVYAASKFAVEGLSKAMAIELGASNIRVNTVCRTFIETELTSKNLNDPEFRA